MEHNCGAQDSTQLAKARLGGGFPVTGSAAWSEPAFPQRCPCHLGAIPAGTRVMAGASAKSTEHPFLPQWLH